MGVAQQYVTSQITCSKTHHVYWPYVCPVLAPRVSLSGSSRTMRTRATVKKRETGCWDYRSVRDLEEDTAKDKAEKNCVCVVQHFLSGDVGVVLVSKMKNGKCHRRKKITGKNYSNLSDGAEMVPSSWRPRYLFLHRLPFRATTNQACRCGRV